MALRHLTMLVSIAISCGVAAEIPSQDLSATGERSSGAFSDDFSQQDLFGPGTSAAGVNLMSGRHSYSVPLGAVSAPGVSFPLTLNYVAGNAANLQRDPIQANTGAFGYGWRIDIPFIATDHRGTTDIKDDVFYVNLGSYGSGRLVSPDGVSFQLSSNPSVKVTLLAGATPEIIKGWKADFPDGTVMILGVREDATRKMLRNGKSLVQDAAITETSGSYPYRWDVAEIRAPMNRGVVRFNWTKRKGSLSFKTGSSYDQESLLASIWGYAAPYTVNAELSTGGADVGSALFDFSGSKGKDELFTTAEVNAGTTERLFPEIKYLKSVSLRGGNAAAAMTWKLQYTVPQIGGYKRRLLNSVHARYDLVSADEPERWWFDYDQTSGWLKSVTTPQRVKQEYAFASVAAPTSNPQFALGISSRKPLIYPVGDFFYVVDTLSKNTVHVSKKTGGTYRLVQSIVGPVGVKYDFYPDDGRFFLVAKAAPYAITVYEWDGSSFVGSPLSVDPVFPDLATIETPSLSIGNGFVVVKEQKKANVSGRSDYHTQVTPIIKTATGWQQVNIKPSNGPCGITPTYNYQEAWLDNTCMVFGASPNEGNLNNYPMDVAVTGDVISLAHFATGNVAVFRRIPGTATFQDETSLMTGISGYTRAGANANIDWGFPRRVQSGTDYFVVGGTSTNAYSFLMWWWNGTNWVGKAVYDALWNSAARVPVLAQNIDGFVVVEPNGKVSRFRRTGKSGEQWSKVVLTAVGLNSTKQVMPLVTVSDKLTAIEFRGGDWMDVNPAPDWYIKNFRQKSTTLYGAENATEASIPLARCLNGTCTYESYLFKDDGVTATDVSSSLTLGSSEGPKTKVYGLKFSPTKEWVLAWCATKPDFSPCANMGANGQCSEDLYQIKLNSDGTLGAAKQVVGWNYIADANGKLPAMNTMGFGSGTMLQYRGGNLEFWPLYATGISPSSAPLEYQVVSAVTNTSLYNNTKGKVTSKTLFKYAQNNATNSCPFDGARSSIVSGATSVESFAGIGAVPVTTQLDSFWVESLVNGIPADKKDWAGQLLARKVTNKAAGTISRSVPLYTTRTSADNPGWAPSIRMVVPCGSADTVFQVNALGTAKAYQSTESYQKFWNPISGAPEVSIQLAGADDGTYKHTVQVQNFNTAGYPLGMRSARYRTRDEAKKFLMRDAATSFVTNIQNAVNGGTAVPVAATETSYDANLRDVVGVNVWGLQTKNGATATGSFVAKPQSFDVAGAWTAVSQLGPRSVTGDLIQSASFANPNFPMYQVKIHEGAMGLASAVASGTAQRKEIAVLTAEDGANTSSENFTNTRSDKQGRWENLSSGVRVFDNAKAHTGKWSIRVENDFGPTVNVPLDGILARKEGLYLSVWGYCDVNTIAPFASIQLYTSNGANPVTSYSATPVGGYKMNTWQLWTVRISSKDLAAANLGAGGYARAFMGNLTSGAKLWVDDFVVAPTGTAVALRTYDDFGRPVTSLDQDGHLTTTEYGARGEVKAVRDERGRLFGQTAVIPTGEN